MLPSLHESSHSLWFGTCDHYHGPSHKCRRFKLLCLHYDLHAVQTLLLHCWCHNQQKQYVRRGIFLVRSKCVYLSVCLTSCLCLVIISVWFCVQVSFTVISISHCVMSLFLFLCRLASSRVSKSFLIFSLSLYMPIKFKVQVILHPYLHILYWLVYPFLHIPYYIDLHIWNPWIDLSSQGICCLGTWCQPKTARFLSPFICQWLDVLFLLLCLLSILHILVGISLHLNCIVSLFQAQWCWTNFC